MRHIDLILASLITLGSSLIGAHAIQQLRHELSGQPSISSIPSGASDYLLAINGSCPGSLHLGVTRDLVTLFNINGTLNSHYGANSFVHTVIGKVYFNPLEQLISADFQLKGPNQVISVTMQDPHPISIQVVAQGSINFDYRFSIPGPITLGVNADGTLKVIIPDETFPPLLRSALGPGLVQPFTVVKASEREKACTLDRASAASLDLLPYTKFVGGGFESLTGALQR